MAIDERSQGTQILLFHLLELLRFSEDVLDQQKQSIAFFVKFPILRWIEKESLISLSCPPKSTIAKKSPRLLHRCVILPYKIK